MRGNMQVADILPSKTFPTVGRGSSGKRTRSKPTASFEEAPAGPVVRSETMESTGSNVDEHDKASSKLAVRFHFLPLLILESHVRYGNS